MTSDRGRKPLTAWAFLAPYAVAVGLLIAVPALLNLGYAFTDHTGLTRDPQFVGLSNVRRMLDDGFLLDSVRASAIHLALAVPLRLLAAVGLGLLLAAPRPGGRWFRVAVYLPTVVPDVALAVLFLWVLNPLYGPLNQLLGLFGHSGFTWLSDPGTARVGVALMLMFPIGEGFLVVLAARRMLDGRLYEAAALEGCGPFGQLRRLTLPLLAPVLLLLAVRDTILTLQVNFVPAYVLTDGRPSNATLYLPVYIFDQAFEFSGFAYGALITSVLMVVTAIVITALLLVVRRWRVLR
ncbi:carbohydrate ABC transporter permease [Micromonospora avicenniae]|uniref:Carbohydrate ABC transporter membrane protein 1, CUT1 family n=1 Tax=Micromonospora avicenniae TaxID=1198245 RepID=A0A1N7DFB3_9ACTN|nr:sugar ABC transporter permease [Micromonospora avicenniae]SIR74511.1 carbohydrate ABC transporter membrane protein 1, CUT1 family [Micromonospora avicenniae]